MKKHAMLGCFICNEVSFAMQYTDTETPRSTAGYTESMFCDSDMKCQRLLIAYQINDVCFTFVQEQHL